jgi:UDP-glucose-4-epimerase GalE
VNVLVTGGAGYIGSHTCKALAAAGITPIALDNLSNGNAWSVQWGPLVCGDIGDTSLVRKLLREYSISAVVHFAAYAYVGESMKNATKYFTNNLAAGIALLDAMQSEGVKTLVFSSSCATYGEPLHLPIKEDAKTHPVNPYGETKLMFEGCLRWYAKSHGLKFTSLRYFNAAGADPDGDIGEQHTPETHLIPCAIHTALGLQNSLIVFGTDYPTPDGTCIRDYVHVSDLARAHVRALDRLRPMPDGFHATYNLGTGFGHSISEVIRAVEQCSGRSLAVSWEARRPGDPPVLIASSEMARKELGWSPSLSTLETIVASAYAWHSGKACQFPVRSDAANDSPLPTMPVTK